MHCVRIRPHGAALLLLALTLLLAQWIGMAHRVAHASLLYDHGASASAKSGERSEFHSCAAFDAASVGDVVHFAAFNAGLTSSARVLALWAAFLCWDAPPANFFSSRAPPAV